MPNIWWCNMSHCLLFDERDMFFLRSNFTIGKNDRELLEQVELDDVVVIYFDGRLNNQLHREYFGSSSRGPLDRSVRALCKVTGRHTSGRDELKLEPQDVYLDCWMFSSPIKVTREMARILRPRVGADGPFDLNGNIKERYLYRFSNLALAGLAAISPSGWPSWSDALFSGIGEQQVAIPDLTYLSDSKQVEVIEQRVAHEGAEALLDAKRRTVARMASTARYTAAGANGQQVLRTVKNKEVRFSDSQELERYIEELISIQGGRCAITEVQLQFDDEHNDPELLFSLDRIDSDGHYEAGNLQVVCRFINRWKSDSNDAEFRRLIELVRSTGKPR